MQFFDVSRAHPHCDVLSDNIYIEAPTPAGPIAMRGAGTAPVTQDKLSSSQSETTSQSSMSHNEGIHLAFRVQNKTRLVLRARR